ncbi:MAG: hypothetical protein NTU80_04495 [Verrucomicrobia bacterium]|nr:hypothetical protein [Verrucomicrobiota bacterium]
MRSCPPSRLLSAFALLALALAPALASAAEAKIARIWPTYRTTASFTRIAEYFGGKESAPELIVRSQPETRDGYYFLTRFDLPSAQPGALIALEYIVPGDDVPRVKFFSVNLPKGSRAVFAGLTGSDWPDAKTQPTAWRLRLLGAGGQELARQQSFLWSLPPAAAAPSVATTTP